MIKTIKKIDIHGNEIWQEVYVCNRCKRTLEKNEYMYTTRWKSCFLVKPDGMIGCDFSQGNNPDIHLCEKCAKAVEIFWNGSNPEQTIDLPKMTTSVERVNSHIEYFRSQSTAALKELLHSVMCGRDSAEAIKIVLKERKEV